MTDMLTTLTSQTAAMRDKKWEELTESGRSLFMTGMMTTLTSQSVAVRELGSGRSLPMTGMLTTSANKPK